LGGVDTIITGDRAISEYKSRSVSDVNVDATGVGAGVAPYMQRGNCSAFAVKVASSPTQKTELGEFQILRDQIWWACREWLRTDLGAMLPPDEELIEELTCPTYEVVNGKVRIMKKDLMRELLKRSPDRADALCLTFAPSSNFFDNCEFVDEPEDVREAACQGITNSPKLENQGGSLEGKSKDMGNFFPECEFVDDPEDL
jgi:hypothetical protein